MEAFDAYDIVEKFWDYKFHCSVIRKVSENTCKQKRVREDAKTVFQG